MLGIGYFVTVIVIVRVRRDGIVFRIGPFGYRRAMGRPSGFSGWRCVRVVHGKGLNSPDSLPVLKNVVDRVLRHRADVLAFHSTPPAQGGTGAVLVLLARR